MNGLWRAARLSLEYVERVPFGGEREKGETALADGIALVYDKEAAELGVATVQGGGGVDVTLIVDDLSMKLKVWGSFYPLLSCSTGFLVKLVEGFFHRRLWERAF
ncbi:hypothetical protein U1Q18_021225 [Sarracenia purpurea var. burkii]